MESGLSPAERGLFWYLHHERNPNHGFAGFRFINVEAVDACVPNHAMRTRAELVGAGLMRTDPSGRYISLTWDGWEALRRAMMTTRGPDEQRVL